MILQADRIIYGDSRIAPGTDALLVREGRIAAIAPLEALQAGYPDEEVTRYSGATVLPGLIDVHTHLGADGGLMSFDTPYAMTIYAVNRLALGLKAGVTTVRDVGTADGLAQAVNKARADGWVRVPRIVPSNQALCITGGHGCRDGLCVECDGVDAVRAGVRNQIKRGARWIKLMDSEGWRGQEFSQEELDAIVDEAHRFHIPVSAHAGCQPSVDMCVQAGCDSIEHGTYMTLSNAMEMKKKDQTWVPTILAFWQLHQVLSAGGTYMGSGDDGYSGPAIEQYVRRFKSLYDTGVRVATGTDMVLPGQPPLPVAREAGKMVEYGITPLQAIEAATKNGAELLRMSDTLGQLKEGYTADLLVVEGDPSADITALERVVAVYQDGVLID